MGIIIPTIIGHKLQYIFDNQCVATMSDIMNNTRALCINVDYSTAVASCNAIWSTDNTDTIKNSQIKWKWAFGQYVHRDTRSGNGINFGQ